MTRWMTMISVTRLFLAPVVALGAGVIAGVFFAFSNFVMPALTRIAPQQGIAAMQAINVVVLNRWFLAVFLGTAAGSAWLVLTALLAWSEPCAAQRLAAGLLYLFGTLLVTGRGNVPLNEALAACSPNSPQAAAIWARYVEDWSRWNHVRAAASFATALLLTFSSVSARLPSVRALSALALALGLGGCSPNSLQAVAPPGAQQAANRLSQLGVFQGDLKRQQPKDGFVPYDVNVAAYSGDAGKRRFIYVPPGSRIRASADRWELPEGSYLIKTFAFPIDVRDPSLGERLIETRVLVKTSAGLRAATYLWNAEQTDALASAGDLDVPVSFTDSSGKQRQQLFHVPSASECESCHAGRVLGWRSRQLDLRGDYADGSHDQIAHFALLGLIDRAPAQHAVLANPFGDAPLALRARSYLDGNCSHCHGAGGHAERTDLLWDLEHTEAGKLPICRDTFPIDGRDHVLVPGQPEQSAFLARMRSLDPAVHMPRGVTGAPDRRGIELLSAWVSSLPQSSCR